MKSARPRDNMTLRNTISFYKDLLSGLKIQWDRKYEKVIREYYPNDIAIENYFIDITRKKD